MSMLKNMDLHLVPAYGRDYTSRDQVLSAWKAGKDFQLTITGQYCSARDVQDLPGEVWVRYAKLRKITRVQ